MTDASDERYGPLDRKIDLMLKLLALDKLYGKTLIEQVDILTNVGMEAPEIATILGTTPENVRAQKSRLRKRKEGVSK
jgi:hypothetical protein